MSTYSSEWTKEDKELRLNNYDAWVEKHKEDICITNGPDMYHYVKGVETLNGNDISTTYYTWDYFMKGIVYDDSQFSKDMKSITTYYNEHTGEVLPKNREFYDAIRMKKKQQVYLANKLCTEEELTATYTPRQINKYQNFYKDWILWFMIIVGLFVTLFFGMWYIWLIYIPLIIYGFVMQYKIRRDQELRSKGVKK